MALKEISFASYNERDTIKGWIYTPTTKPKAIVQIIHGFGEHSRRYLHMIQSLLDAGYIVCADDHVGHGKTALDGNTWGDYGYKGYKTTTEDEQTLHNMMIQEFPDLPYFIFGHSWGSMIARDYAINYGDQIAGLILCGTGALLGNLKEVASSIGKLVENNQGDQVNPEFLVQILGSFTERYTDVKTPNDWICTDSNVVLDHATDPLNCFNPPTNQSIYDFVQLWIDISSKEWAQKIPARLPVYLIAGDQDPVGNYGEGIYKVANWLWETGKTNVKTQIYSGYRHEIHNEPEIREAVEAGIIKFFDALV